MQLEPHGGRPALAVSPEESADSIETLHWRETGLLLRIAAPLAGSYVAQFAIFLTTRLVVGRLGAEEFAAVGLAGTILFGILACLEGILSIVAVLAAHAIGRGEGREVGNIVRQGLVLAALLAVPFTLLTWSLGDLLKMLGQDPGVVTYSEQYLRAVAWSILPTLGFHVLKEFLAALARAGVILAISIGGVGLNLGLTAGLAFGWGGLPAMGVAGAGWATTIVSWAMFLALAAYVLWHPAFRKYAVLSLKLGSEWTAIREILRLGLPIAAIVILEAGLFASVALLSGVFGATSLAAYYVLEAFIGASFTLSIGLGEAAMVRVAYQLGRGDIACCRFIGLVALAIAVSIAASMMILPLLFPDFAIRVFLESSDSDFGEVEARVRGLLLFVAVFQVFDALQGVAARALRGLQDTTVPLAIAGTGYWLLGLGGGVFLAFGLDWEVVGLWLGLATGFIATGLLLTFRFLWLTAKPRDSAA